jgi:hypothetical protein
VKRVILSTKLIIGDGLFEARELNRDEAQSWVDAGPVDNYCGHVTVRLLGLEPDTSRRTCDEYDQALALNAKSRLEFGREYTVEEIEEIGVEFTLITKK